MLRNLSPRTLETDSSGAMIPCLCRLRDPRGVNTSGIITFIVNPNGKVYQHNLGEKTPKLQAR